MPAAALAAIAFAGAAGAQETSPPAPQPTGAESDFFGTAFTQYHDTVDTPSDGDLWPSCWGDDDNLYAANGDGRGFSDQPWSDIVMNRIFGTPETGITGERLAAGEEIGNTWTAPQPGATYNMKPTGMVCVDSDGDGEDELYMAIQDLRVPEPGPYPNFADNPGFNDAPAASISRSEDKGETWQKTDGPMFTDHEFTTIWFLDYGKSNENAIQELGPVDGNFVYAYGLDGNWRDSFSNTVPDPTDLYLARVPKTSIQDRDTWQWYDGKGPGDVPLWTSDIDSKEPVLTDERRVYPTNRRNDIPKNNSVLSQASIVYNEPLDRYIYTSWTEYTFEFYEAPNPWGPWKLFSRKDFGAYPWFNQAPGCINPKNGGYSLQIPSKFISDDGKRMWVQSNWFEGGASCGGSNYNFSLRPLDVEPYTDTTAGNAPDQTDNIARRSSTTPIEKSAHFGNGEFYNDNNSFQNEDSFDWENKQVDFWGYEWPREYNMDRVVYTTGNMFGNGGWFVDDLRVQVRRNFEWVDVTGLTVTPDYPYSPAAGTNQTYTFRFDDIAGDGVRIIGAPAPGPVGCEGNGCDGYFTSIAELAVYYDSAPAQEPDPDPTPNPGPSGSTGGGTAQAHREPIVRIARRALRVDRKRRTSVRVRCPRSTLTRCEGIVTVLTRSKVVARRSFSIAPEQYRTVRLRVRREAYRQLREGKGRRRVDVYLLSRGADKILRRDEARLTMRRGG